MQRFNVRRWLAIALPAVLFVAIFLAIGFVGGHNLSVAADPQDPDLPPPFEGEPVTATLQLPADFSRQAAVPVADTTVYTETFEGGLPNTWSSFDNNDAVGGVNSWDTTTIMNGISITGTRSVWAIAGGDGPAAGDTYPAQVDSFLLYGPLDLSNIKDAHTTFDYLLDVNVAVSDTLSVFTGLEVSPGTLALNGLTSVLPTPDWINRSYTLWPDYVGQDNVYVVFRFETGTAGTDQLGALIDNFVLTAEPLDNSFLPYMALDPTPTPTVPAPTESYQEPFNASGTGWDVVRRRNINDTIDNVLTYVSRTDSYLQAEVKSSNDYFILSPLVRGRSAPFEIEVKAEIANEADKSGFGIVFGADYNGTPSSCPNASFNGCFNEYYAVQVRYRTDDKTELEVQRITQHDGNNQPINQVSLGKSVFDASQVDGDAENVWNVLVNADGTIIVQANDITRMTLPGPRTIVNPYFGLNVFRDEGSQGARINFYRYCFGEQGDPCEGVDGGGGGQTEYNYEFNDAADLAAWRDDVDGQGNNRTLGVSTSNSIAQNSGKLEIVVNKSNQFVIYSPLQPINSSSYALETSADFSLESDGDEYGIIWAANWDTSKPCPNINDQFLSCMNTLYVARIRYINETATEVRLAKINGQRDANGNLGFENLKTATVSVDSGGTVVWRVEYNTSSGDMNLLANGVSVLTFSNKDYAAQKYFGLMAVTTPGNDIVTARFDYFRVTSR